MLIITRTEGESFQIADNVTVTVLSKSKNQVKFGFVAPKNVTVHRSELYDKINDDERKK